MASLEFPFPSELICEIIELVPLVDQKSISLVSQLTRQFAIPFIFGHLRYTFAIIPKIREIHQARKDIKEAIKRLEFKKLNIKEDDISDLFHFLETLPHLRTLEYEGIPPKNISRLIDSLRRTPLHELVLDTGFYATIGGPPTPGLAGLQKFSIHWFVGDESAVERGIALLHLEHLILPSLTTLVELKIYNQPEEIGRDFDLQLLRPAGKTLRTFEYGLKSLDEKILGTIPEIFPHLTKLVIEWENLLTGHSVLWNDAHINALSKNTNLIDLTLSSDFEHIFQDSVRASHDPAWYARCYERRLRATQDIASACPQLQRSSWVQMGATPTNGSMLHPFVVEEQVTSGKTKRVVRGVKQSWMGMNHENWRPGGGIVKCRLEDLPGDIIGENYPDVDLDDGE